jgi:hypothetical protein
MFKQFQANPIEDKQAGIPVKLYQCTDGVMRTSYERSKFEESIEWTWLGFRVRSQTSQGQ